MFKNSTFLVSIALTAVVMIWGAADITGMTSFAQNAVELLFRSRGWFVMLTVTVLLLCCVGLALSPTGKIRLGRDDDQPEFSTFSWMTMMFAAGMGVGLLFYGVSEPIIHFLFLEKHMQPQAAASKSLILTVFHWGFHAWAIYGLVGLVIAYFAFRHGEPQMLSAPIVRVFGKSSWARPVGWLVDVMTIYAIAIGLAGSFAMGVFQAQSGIVRLLDIQDPGLVLTLPIFVAVCAAYMYLLARDLSSGMAVLSNTAIIITACLLVYILLIGPTHFLMGTLIQTLGEYLVNVLSQGFQTYTFWEGETQKWFSDWTLNYMAWWLAWSPFVGVFIARISKGRTIRQFIVGVLLAPTGFSLCWFGILGAMGFFQAYNGTYDASIAQTDINATTFAMLETLPGAGITSLLTLVSALLFIITSVVSAAYVLAMFSEKGSQNPRTRIKLIWGRFSEPWAWSWCSRTASWL